MKDIYALSMNLAKLLFGIEDQGTFQPILRDARTGICKHATFLFIEEPSVLEEAAHQPESGQE